jgi:tripartite-type tricarboxylate transporter receptor subunit TctC
VKVYGTTTPKRLSALPNVPTLDQEGFKNFEVKVWHGLYTPKNVPQAIQTRLNTALKAALNDPAVKKRLADSNIDIVSMDKVSAKSLKTHLDNEINKWGPVIRKANIPD